MAKILGQDDQQRALKEIRAALKSLVPVNEFLDGHNPEGTYHISFSDSEGKRFSAELYSESKGEIDALVRNYKERVKTHILELARNNRIVLDPEDNDILGISGDV